MNILVTGGAGFVGLNLLGVLQAAGHTVTIADIDGTDALLDLAGHTGPRDLMADVRSLGTCRYLVKRADAVVHLAALPGVVSSKEDPEGCWESNATAALYLLEAARDSECRRVVLVSSGAAVGPVSPYGASKAAVEALGAAWGACWDLEVVTVRPTNMYGPWCHRKGSVLALWCKAALAGQPLVMEGTGRQTRDFLYVEDCARALLLAATVSGDRLAAAPGRVVPVGYGWPTALSEVPKLVARAAGLLEVKVVPGAARPGDVAAPGADLLVAGEVLGWQATVDLAEGLEGTVAWLRSTWKETETAVRAPLRRQGDFRG